MQTRKPAVAGQFYPGQYEACVDEINECLETGTIAEPLPDTIHAAIVPHAGWTFSGCVAALAFSAIRQQHEKVHTFVIFGAAHGYFGQAPAVYDRGTWTTPLGEAAVDEDLADAVVSGSIAVGNTDAHAAEHSIEVQVPFIQHLFAGAKILPVLVPAGKQAVALGMSIGDIIKQDDTKKIVCIASTDLTHYGPRYRFTPMGTGTEALEWASGVNDQEFIDLAMELEAEKMLTHAAENSSACGPGAAAAAVAVARKLGKTKAVLLAHTNSNEVMIRKMGTSSADSVGYAAIVF
jgi:AmmeMemoRadiSam system protein B